MALTAFVRHGALPRAYVCRQCQLRRIAPRIAPRIPTRAIGQGFIRKTIEAEWEWKEQAKEIEAGRKQSFLDMLEERGFVKQVAGDRNTLDRLMTNKRIGGYCGVDPTAPSLHVGHMLPFMVIFWMYLHGFQGRTVLGGSTAKIGDPTDRLTGRKSAGREAQKTQMVHMHVQLKKLWMSVERKGRNHGFVRQWGWLRALDNNSSWLSKLDIIEFLRTLGTGVRLGTMLSRDTVKNRQKKGDGMSFAEFTYPLLQAWDWWQLYVRNGVQLQVGGSDQFGNIVAGIDAINHIRKNTLDPDERNRCFDLAHPKNNWMKEPYGLTVPLLTTASGEKFGKSAGNAVWLSPDMTSSFDLYGFWVRTSDADVERYLKLFTFLPMSTIKTVIEQHKQNPSLRVAQHLLALEFVDFAHGTIAAKQAESEHRKLFGQSHKPQATAPQSPAKPTPEYHEGDRRGDINMGSGNKSAPQVSWDNAPSPNVVLPRSLVYGTNFPRVLWAAGMVASRSEGHRITANRGAYVGSRPGQVGGFGDELTFTPIFSAADGVPEEYIYDSDQLLLRIGKWKVKVVKIVPDDVFVAEGRTAPGWDAEAGRPEATTTNSERKALREAEQLR